MSDSASPVRLIIPAAIAMRAAGSPKPIGIDWPLRPGAMPGPSAKDQVQPLLADFASPLSDDGRPFGPRG